jgi:putative integral membrane protein (TIGR02587 family)
MLGALPGVWEKERDDFARAFSGAFLFGTPLLFTMEMWWIGEFADAWRLLIFLGVTFALNVYLNELAGFRREQSSLIAAIREAIDALAVGVVSSLVVLVLLNQIDPSDPLPTIAAKVAIQTVPLSIGASLANAVFAPGKSREGDEDEGPGPRAGPWRASINDVGATIIGGIFLGSAVAPTDEVPMLAAQMHPWHELGLVLFSLALTYVIVFESGFGPTSRGHLGASIFRHPLTQTATAYVVSFATAGLLLWFFHQVEFGDPVSFTLSHVLVLAVPVSIGGAAGRLLI